LEFVKEKPKKKRKSTGKKATNVESANDQSGSEIGHGKMNKTNTKKQDSSKQHTIDQTTDLPAPSRPSMDTLDPINEEDNIVVAPRVDSTNSLVPSQHDSAICAADAEAIHVRTDPLKSILVNRHETARPSSRSSDKRPSSSQRRSSPPPNTVYTKPTLVAIEKDHIITATPGVGSVPVLPTALDKTADAQAGAGNKQFEWPDDVFWNHHLIGIHLTQSFNTAHMGGHPARSIDSTYELVSISENSTYEDLVVSRDAPSSLYLAFLLISFAPSRLFLFLSISTSCTLCCISCFSSPAFFYGLHATTVTIEIPSFDDHQASEKKA
jgi:hypothetical protein